MNAIAPLVGSPDLMEHVLGVIKEVLDEHDRQKSIRESIIESRASNWPPFLQRSREQEREEVSLRREQKLEGELKRASAAHMREVREGRSKKSKLLEKRIFDAAQTARFLHPQKDVGGITNQIHPDVAKWVKQTSPRKKKEIGFRAVYNYVKKHWSQTAPALPKKRPR
jgi:hypothetical protein